MLAASARCSLSNASLVSQAGTKCCMRPLAVWELHFAAFTSQRTEAWPNPSLQSPGAALRAHCDEHTAAVQLVAAKQTIEMVCHDVQAFITRRHEKTGVLGGLTGPGPNTAIPTSSLGPQRASLHTSGSRWSFSRSGVSHDPIRAVWFGCMTSKPTSCHADSGLHHFLVLVIDRSQIWEQAPHYQGFRYCDSTGLMSWSRVHLVWCLKRASACINFIRVPNASAEACMPLVHRLPVRPSNLQLMCSTAVP